MGRITSYNVCYTKLLRDTEGIRLVQRIRSNPMTGMISDVEMEIQVPPSFPDKYYTALVRSAEQCAVKKHMEQPPQFHVHTEVVEH